MARIEIKVHSDAFRTEITRERLDDIAVTAEAVALLVASFGHRSGAAAARALSRVATTHGYRLRDERHPLATAAVDAAQPIIEAQVRAKVAAEIRALCECAASTDLDISRSCEYDRAARIAEGKGDET